MRAKRAVRFPHLAELDRKQAIIIARNLKSEHGENPEYDRALVEFVSDAYGPSHARVADELGIDRCHNCGCVDPGHDMCRECGAEWGGG